MDKEIKINLKDLMVNKEEVIEQIAIKWLDTNNIRTLINSTIEIKVISMIDEKNRKKYPKVNRFRNRKRI